LVELLAALLRQRVGATLTGQLSAVKEADYMLIRTLSYEKGHIKLVMTVVDCFLRLS
jgi:hypothetical protein